MAAVAPEVGSMADAFAGEQMRAAFEATLRKFHNAEIMVYNLIEKYNIDIPHPKVFFFILYRKRGINRSTQQLVLTTTIQRKDTS